MPPIKHSLTEYIIILKEKANKSNYCALCRFCRTKITNTKKLVISHLKNCTIFKEQYTEYERELILFPVNDNVQYENGKPFFYNTIIQQINLHFFYI